MFRLSTFWCRSWCNHQYQHQQHWNHQSFSSRISTVCCIEFMNVYIRCCYRRICQFDTQICIECRINYGWKINLTHKINFVQMQKLSNGFKYYSRSVSFGEGMVLFPCMELPRAVNLSTDFHRLLLTLSYFLIIPSRQLVSSINR